MDKHTGSKDGWMNILVDKYAAVKGGWTNMPVSKAGG